MEVSDFPLGLMPRRRVEDAAAMQPRSQMAKEEDGMMAEE
jgi:hypothetical protein